MFAVQAHVVEAPAGHTSRRFWPPATPREVATNDAVVVPRPGAVLEETEADWPRPGTVTTSDVVIATPSTAIRRRQLSMSIAAAW